MSRLNIGDKVIVKSTNEKGIVKGRDIIGKGDGTFDVQYIVKLGDGYENWKPFNKRELKRNNPNKQKKKNQINSITITAKNGYKVTVVSVLKETFLTYTLTIGYSICNPNDVFDEKFGINLAKHRALTNPFSKYFSIKKKDFTEETATAIIAIKANYIANNIEEFINRK